MLFLDENTEIITPCWIEQMLKLLLRPDVGTVGANNQQEQYGSPRWYLY